ncbi:hypothetical protein [Acinetobacter sp. YH12117]|uniref:hypothetical protein n=1 Tax=Acinetobacter sp. YH12117 TaxID=2601104 RepID=UPI0015D18405|nr:hypothetical protein [Acinetobacter sp. YH12117]
MLNIFKLVSTKLLSISAVISVFIYLYLLNGFELIGEYSALTAVVAPLVTFSLYKYLELINIACNDNKKFFLQEILPSTVITYLFGCLFLILINYFLEIFDQRVFLIFIFIKYLDLRFELSIGFFSSKKNFSYVLKQNFIRIFMFWFVALIFFLSNFSIDLELALVVYLISQLPIFLYEFFLIREKYNLCLVRKYIISNFKYGVLNTVVSLNSIVPRYLIMYFGDNKSLGIYTILHLFSSNFVNVLQHPLSVYCEKINQKIDLDLRNKLIFPGFSLFFSGFILVWFDEDYFLLFIFFILVLASFLIRGVFITISVVRNVNLNFFMILSIVFSAVFICLYVYMFNLNNYVVLGCLYILCSNFIFMVLGERKVSKAYE